MAQMVSRGGPNPVMAGVVTVADLLNRAAAAPKERAVPRTSGSVVSVNSLLRREGRAEADDAAATSPVRQPKAGMRPEVRGLARGSAVAVGTLLAAGSVFGTAVVTDAGHVASKDSFDSGYPGQGRLNQGDAAPQAQAPLSAPLDHGTPASALDAGVGAPTSWTQVAFPGPSIAGLASGGATQGATQGAMAAAPAVTPPQAQAPVKKLPAPQPPAQQPAAPAQQQGNGGVLGAVDNVADNLGDKAPVLAPVTDLLTGGNDNGSHKSSDESNRSSGDQQSQQQQGGGGGLLGGLTHTVGSLLG